MQELLSDIERALVDNEKGGYFRQFKETVLLCEEDCADDIPRLVFQLEEYLSNKLALGNGSRNKQLFIECANYAQLLSNLKRVVDAISWYEKCDEILQKLNGNNPQEEIRQMKEVIYRGMAECYSLLDEKGKASHYRNKLKRICD